MKHLIITSMAFLLLSNKILTLIVISGWTFYGIAKLFIIMAAHNI